ncbi:chemotaxis protein CheW, partial [candidate division KSB1 bacterium]|nr:chemotaxis protein CheW [candidate division KSB1 bacterium]
ILRLPLTLATLHAMLVTLDNTLYAIPLVYVLEAVVREEADISTVEGREVIRLRGNVVPLVHLGQALGIPGSYSKGRNQTWVVIVKFGEKLVGLAVDELTELQEIVVKSLGQYIGNVKGIAGASVLGDGRVVLIDFWASWCQPCREELPLLDILNKTYGREDFKVVTVNIDNHPKNAVKFLETYSIKVAPLWDQKKKVVSAYDVQKMPTTILIDKNGWIRYIHSGFETEQFLTYKREIEILLKEGKTRTKRRTPVRRD